MTPLFRLMMCWALLAGMSTVAYADFALTRVGTGPISLRIPAGAVQDAAGNVNELTTLTIADAIAPEIFSRSPDEFDGPDPFSFRLVFNEAVTGLALDDFVVENGTKANLTGNNLDIYSFEITPIDINQDITITLPADAVTDRTGNGNAEYVATITANPDVDGPVATFDVPETFKLQEPFTATITFDEDVVGFELADLEVIEATLSNFVEVSATEFTFDVTPDGLDTIELALPADAVEDAFGNGNARVEATITNAGNVEETLAANAAFMSMRGKRIMTDRPDYKAIALRGTKPTGAYSFAYGTTGITGDLNAHKAVNLNERWLAWTQVTSSISRTQDNELRFAMLIAGIQRDMNDRLTLGFTGQVDYGYLRNDSASSRVKGVGWMFGPYLVYRVPEQSLTFEFETSWGQSSNDTNPVGLYEDTFKTDRFLIAGEVSLDLYRGDWTISPALAMRYFRETQHSYVDTIGFTIPKQTVSFGDAIFGFDFRREWLLENQSTIALNLGLAGAYAFEANTGGAQDLFQENALTPRLNADLQWSHGAWVFDFSVFQEGLGMAPIGATDAENYSTWGVQAALGVNF